MRFLCFHGEGTNSKIFETQTAALRYELGETHTYHFVEGCVRTEAWRELRETLHADDEYFTYFNSPESCTRASRDLDVYLAAEGPFDAVLAFSIGASFASTYIAHNIRQNSVPKKSNPTFNFAVFFSLGPGTFRSELSEKGEARLLTNEVDGEIIHIPTAHIWGVNDTLVTQMFRAIYILRVRGRSIYMAPVIKFLGSVPLKRLKVVCESFDGLSP